ncbi:GDP-perosamine synthase [Amycolatopsis deserti]|uniref:GDP-perosamine synthase n=1 Tax=Amycolatopsis deserti TaxID=185696 RepID=A0ABQ3J4S0_9PSEU|nr:DegT/DnrJ/EryC1/StrS family aminotransferase [Amycolatopsis deserti]GHE98789.1 GDP-perosamine synthase [Amycolatopsis deserti]
MIPLSEPVLQGNELRYVQECVHSRYVSSVGPFVGRFEREFAAAVGVRHAVACASGTAALHVALRLAGARPGRLVAVSDFTFIASANAVSYTGADLLLVDSEPDTWNMNTAMLRDEVFRRAKLGRRMPSVVEVVHVLGHPADIEPLLELRSRFGIRIVEDAAESLGASWVAGSSASRQVGSLGDFGCFSFNGNKIMTTGGGGMIVTDDADAARLAKHLTMQAKLPDRGYHHDMVGYNYRLTNIAAALGVAQLERLGDAVRAKHRIAERYEAGLADAPLVLAPHAQWAEPTHWLYSVLLRGVATGTDEVVERLEAQGVGARRVWPPLHRQQPYQHVERLGGGTAEDIYRRGVSLPSSIDMKEADQDIAIAALAEVIK